MRCTRALTDGRQVRDITVPGSVVGLRGLDAPMCVFWVWLYRNKEPEQRFVRSNLDLGGRYLTRLGRRRWRIEAFFKTLKGRFGLERFTQHSKQGVLRWWYLSGMAFVRCHSQHLDVPLKGVWADWSDLARTARLSFLRCAVARSNLNPFQHALPTLST
jgi:Transposase DDE domain